MKVAILESIIMPAGHEVEFDRILVDELNNQGHEPCFFVPEKFIFKIDYNASVEYLSGGDIVSYAGAGKLKKLWLSIKREHRRIQWFNSAYEKACRGLCDAIIVPTASFRFIRTLLKSKLKNSPVPVYFIFHGMNHVSYPKFINQAKKCADYENIYLRVITLRNDFENLDIPRLGLVNPPLYKPINFSVDPDLNFEEPLKLGFFGLFRKEKKLDFLLEAFEKANFKVPVSL